MHRLVIAFALLLVLAACANGATDETAPPTEPTATSAVLEATSQPQAAGTDVPQPSAATPTPPGEPAATPTTTDPEPTPARPAATDELQTVRILERELQIPVGYAINVYAEGLGNARFMAEGPDGAIYVTDRSGRVVRLSDRDGDGIADDTLVVASGLENPHGITWHNGELYVAEMTRVIKLTEPDPDGVFHGEEVLVEGLPSGGHWSRTIEFGPDGDLYVSIGSSCNICAESDPYRATIWRFDPDGNNGHVFATGLRNAVGIQFQPGSNALWATNNGTDGMGDDVPPETVMHVSEGDDFGWPRCHAGTIADPRFGDCAGVAVPDVLIQAHSAPLGLEFIRGPQFAQFEGDLLVALHGSWNRSEPTGYKVVRAKFENGMATGDVVDFVSGWLPDGGGDRWGRPVDVLIGSDGTLYISDDSTGIIYRLARED